VLFEGAPVSGDPLAYRRRMAVVFQEPLLLDATVESNVGTGLALRGVPREERRARVRDWLGRFGISELASRPARALSGGEAQRTSLARALVLEPEVLLLDEPFAALDEPTRQALIDDLARLLAQTGAATVFVTHDREEALRLGDRLAVLMAGRVRQEGTPQQVFAAPADEEVAAFVGIETIAAGRVESVADGLALVRVGGRPIEAGGDVRPGDAVLVCLRPEDITLGPTADGAPTSARNHLPATVTRVTSAGAWARVEIDAGFPAVSLITRQSLEDLALAPGSAVVATFKAAAVHLIRRQETGDRSRSRQEEQGGSEGA
jgi:tungstate transport system ATP-binding protein